MEQRSRPLRRLEASLKAVSDWMPRVAVGFGDAVVVRSRSLCVHDYGFATHGIVLLPAQSPAYAARDDLVERGDGGVDVAALEDEGWKKAKDRFAGAVDDDATVHHLCGDLFGQVGGVEFEAKHQADAADVDDAVVAGGEFGELLVEVVADLLNVLEEIVSFDGVDDGDGDGAGEGTAAEGCAVHAGSEDAAAALVQSIAPMGMPLAMGLARVVTSGRMP